jgi:hypothetical protein
MAAGAGVMLKNGGQQPGGPAAAASLAPGAAPAGHGVLSSLKDELFAIETERLEGRLNDAEYAEQKAALETVLKRALARKGQDAVN